MASPLPINVPSPYSATSPAYRDQIASALDRLCEYAKASAAGSYADLINRVRGNN